MYSFAADENNSIRSRLPSPATLLFNDPMQGIMPIINRIPINSDNDNDYYEVLVKRQIRNDKNYDIARFHGVFSIKSIVVVQWEDGGPLTHATIAWSGNHDHNNKYYTIRNTTTGHIVTRNRKHIKITPIKAEPYLRDQLTWHTDVDMDRILKQYETLSMDRVQSSTSNKRREKTCMNKLIDIHISNTQDIP